MLGLGCVLLDEVGQRGAAMREPGQDMRSTVEKEDIRVDNKVTVSFNRIDVSDRVSVCCGCRHKLRPSEGRLLLT